MLRKYPGAGRLLVPAESLGGVGLEFMLGRSRALVNAFLPCFSILCDFWPKDSFYSFLTLLANACGTQVGKCSNKAHQECSGVWKKTLHIGSLMPQALC